MACMKRSALYDRAGHARHGDVRPRIRIAHAVRRGLFALHDDLRVHRDVAETSQPAASGTPMRLASAGAHAQVRGAIASVRVVVGELEHQASL